VSAGESVLDLDCGTGRLLTALVEQQPAARYVGLDPDPRILRIARRRLTQLGGSVELTEGYSQRLPSATTSSISWCPHSSFTTYPTMRSLPLFARWPEGSDRGRASSPPAGLHRCRVGSGGRVGRPAAGWGQTLPGMIGVRHDRRRIDRMRRHAAAAAASRGLRPSYGRSCRPGARQVPDEVPAGAAWCRPGAGRVPPEAGWGRSLPGMIGGGSTG
jgi:SAM-dependent methyltransferase